MLCTVRLSLSDYEQCDSGGAAARAEDDSSAQLSRLGVVSNLARSEWAGLGRAWTGLGLALAGPGMGLSLTWQICMVITIWRGPQVMAFKASGLGV